MFPMIPIYPMIPNLMKLGISHDEPPTVYALLNSYVNFSKEEPEKIKDLARIGRAMFFDFVYPLATGITNEEFETMILNHFLMRRIGYETVTAFKIALNVKLNEIMPMYNKLFESINNWNIFSNGEIMTRVVTGSNTNSSTNSATSTNTNTTSNSSTSDRRYSDTPQNALSDVQNGNYVSEYNYDHDTSTGSGSNSGSTSGLTSSTGSNTENETITRSPSDKMSLYTEFLKSRQNIYTMIFKDLDSLFYQLI